MMLLDETKWKNLGCEKAFSFIILANIDWEPTMYTMAIWGKEYSCDVLEVAAFFYVQKTQGAQGDY